MGTRTRLLLLGTLGLLLLTGCGGGQGGGTENPVSPGEGIVQTGMASWYGEEFQGKPTASGELFDMYKLTAAHKTFPFGTLVEVENRSNGRRVIVKINDRLPDQTSRIIDLSKAAASELGMIAQGTAEVALRYATTR